MSPGKLAGARRPRGMTLLEVMLAMFIFLVGIVGVLATIPTGVNSADLVVFQDVAIHLAHSKFAAFRRDRVDPAIDLQDGSAYMNGKQEALNLNGWRDFNLEFDGNNFNDIERYEWKVETSRVLAADAAIAAAPKHKRPDPLVGDALQLSLVRVTVHAKGTSREFSFCQYMSSYEK